MTEPTERDREIVDRMEGNYFRKVMPSVAASYDEVAAAARMEERERCAKIADAAKRFAISDWSEGRNEAAEEIAAEIRSGE